jgi:methionyl-tRNA formyltransferase
MRLQASAVKEVAVRYGLRLAQPASLKEGQALKALAEAKAEAMIVAAYGLLLPPAVLAIPARGCINIHASLLPRWRGAAPIQRALLAGDRETGITIMQMDAGLDTGPILLQKELPIEPADTSGTLHDKLAVLGAKCIVDALDQRLTPRAQDETGATYARRIEKSEAIIDWKQPAQMICRQVRAFNPQPGAFTSVNGDILKVWSVLPGGAGRDEAGVIVAAGPDAIVVAAGVGSVSLIELQRAGGKRLRAGAYVAGGGIKAGMRLGT